MALAAAGWRGLTVTPVAVLWVIRAVDEGICRHRGWVVVPREQQLLTVEMHLGRGQFRNMFVCR